MRASDVDNGNILDFLDGYNCPRTCARRSRKKKMTIRSMDLLNGEKNSAATCHFSYSCPPPRCATFDVCRPLTFRFDAAIRNEHGRRRPSLIRACRSTFGREFLNLGWLKAANTVLGFSGPLLLKVVVDAVQDASQSEGER